MTIFLRRGALAIACVMAVGALAAATPAMAMEKPETKPKPGQETKAAAKAELAAKIIASLDVPFSGGGPGEF